jgi:hypothetical protein
MGATTVNGRLPEEVIARIVRQNYGRFNLCYQNGLRNNPHLQGRVSVRFVIGRDGSVSNVGNAGSDLPDESVVNCVTRAYYGLSFPQPEGGIVTVVYPIMFSPKSTRAMQPSVSLRRGRQGGELVIDEHPPPPSDDTAEGIIIEYEESNSDEGMDIEPNRTAKRGTSSEADAGTKTEPNRPAKRGTSGRVTNTIPGGILERAQRAQDEATLEKRKAELNKKRAAAGLPPCP